jgi:hypothetical protein
MHLMRSRFFGSDRAVCPGRGVGGRRVAGILAAVAVCAGFAASSAQAEQSYMPARYAAGPAPLGVAARASHPLTFVGMTNQSPCQMDTDNVFCGAVNVVMTRDLARVKRMLIGFEASCQAPEMFYGSTWTFTQIPTKRSKRNTVAKFTKHVSHDQSLGGGLTAHADTTFAAKVTAGKSGSGTFQTTIGIVDASGQTIDTCTTGPVTYHLGALN